MGQHWVPALKRANGATDWGFISMYCGGALIQRLVAMYPYPADPDKFMDYYTKTHVPIARTMPGVHNLTFGQASMLGEGASPYFFIGEIDFADAAALMNALTSEIGQKAVADIANFSPTGATVIHYTV